VSPTLPRAGRDKSGPYGTGHCCARPYSYGAKIQRTPISSVSGVSSVSLFQAFFRRIKNGEKPGYPVRRIVGSY